MSRVVRIGLPALAAGILCLALSAGPAMAVCGSGVNIFQGGGTLETGFVSAGGLDPVSCGADPYRAFWAFGFGDPAFGLGHDSGASAPGPLEFLPGVGNTYSSDWGNQDVDGCIFEPAVLQGDGTLGPMAVLFNNGGGEGTSAHAGTYAVYSVDLDITFQAYNLDQASTVPFNVCAAIPTPAISGPSGSGPFTATLMWGGVSGYDDCASNSGIDLGTDCLTGGNRALHRGWKVYSKSAPCTVGPLTGDRNLWTAEGGELPAGANAGSLVSISAADAGECRFVAINPVWESGIEGQFVSAHAGPLGGGGDADGDGISDAADTCPDTPGANTDSDGDGLGDICDNCDNHANQSQADDDSDGIGDACDACPGDASNDADGDGVCGAVDNCPSNANPGQEDSDGDGVGDACDGCTSGHDSDGDGICSDLDNCPDDANADQADADGDGNGDECDTCPYEASDDQFLPYGDRDGVCACVPSIFNAGGCPGALGAPFDNCPGVSNPSQTPSGKGDGLGDACEDKFLGTPVVRPINDQGFGDCVITWRTSAEWNCPAFGVIYRSAAGDRSTGVGAPCAGCNSGLRNRTYGGTAGFRIAKCHGGHNIFVQMTRPATCGGLTQYNTVPPVKIEARAARVR